MNFFEPQISLFKEVHLDAEDQYVLHVVTFCDNSAYYADGYDIDDSQAAESILGVLLNLNEDPNAVVVNSPTPVTHTIDLGVLPFEEGFIEVSLNRGTNPKTKVNTTSALEIERPMGEDTVEALWKATFGKHLFS